MVWHGFSIGRVPTDEYRAWSHFFFEASEVAVLGFFVLSAFVLCNSLRDSSDHLAAIVGFWIRRVFRIMPLAIFVVLSTYVFFMWSRHYLISSDPWPRYNDFSLATLKWSLLLLDRTFNPPGWTLIYEVAGYALIPIVFVATGKPSPRTLLYGTTALALWLFFTKLGNWADLSQAFAAGMVAYFINERVKANKVAISLLTTVFVAASVVRYFQPSPYDWTAVTSVLLASLLLLVVMTKPIADALNVSMLQWLGKVSYSIYLIHYPVMWTTALMISGLFEIRRLPDWQLFMLISIPATLVVSAGTYRWVEKPFIALGSKIAGWASSRRLPVIANADIRTDADRV